MYYLMNIFIVQGSMGKKVPNSKTTSEQRYDYIHSSTYSSARPLVIVQSQFWLGSTHFQNHHEIIYFCLNNDYVAGNYFDFHLKKNTKLSDLVI